MGGNEPPVPFIRKATTSVYGSKDMMCEDRRLTRKYLLSLSCCSFIEPGLPWSGVCHKQKIVSTQTSSSSPSDASCFRYALCADVFFAFPHVSVGEAGEVGSLLRRGRGQPSSACGALIAIRKGAKDGPDAPLDPDDMEFGMLKRKVLMQVRQSPWGWGGDAKGTHGIGMGKGKNGFQ